MVTELRIRQNTRQSFPSKCACWSDSGANFPCLQARTCLEIRNPCLYVRKSVLEILTIFDHFCDIRASSSRLMWMWNRRWSWPFHYVIASTQLNSADHILRVRLQRWDRLTGQTGRGYCSVPRMRADKWTFVHVSVVGLLLFAFVHFRKSKLINVILTLCVAWLGLPEAASAAISCPVSAVLDYRYMDIFFKAVLRPVCLICPVMF